MALNGALRHWVGRVGLRMMSSSFSTSGTDEWRPGIYTCVLCLNRNQEKKGLKWEPRICPRFNWIDWCLNSLGQLVLPFSFFSSFYFSNFCWRSVVFKEEYSLFWSLGRVAICIFEDGGHTAIIVAIFIELGLYSHYWRVVHHWLWADLCHFWAIILIVGP